MKFNHGEPISLSLLTDSERIAFSTNIEEILTRIPKSYEVTPAGSGVAVKIRAVGDMPCSKAQRHIIAEKALKQWRTANRPEDKVAWKIEIQNWFGLSPEELAIAYSSETSLYDLFMNSEYERGLESLVGIQDVSNYLLANIIAPLFDTDFLK